MEQIQTSLLSDLSERYNRLHAQARPAIFPIEDFLDKFDYAPPDMLLNWFDFCKHHRKPMHALLNQTNGDLYFKKKLRHILEKYINAMMDNDGVAKDELRSYFVKVFLELHFLSARTWLDSKDDEFLSVNEIVNLLNTMRVGAGYLSYKRKVNPDFDQKMNFEE